MSDLFGEDQEKVRRIKLDRISELGVDPWGKRFDGHQSINDVRELESQITPESVISVRIAGRVMLRRTAGKAIFLNMQDWTGGIQIFCGKSQVAEDWDLLQAIRLGVWSIQMA